jgi:Ca2+-binding RTX toxin-like protein
MAVHEVGPGRTFERVADAVGAARDGDVVTIQAGTYAGGGAIIDKSLALIGVGGMARLVAEGDPANGAILTTRGDIDLRNLELAGASNAAAIRHEGGHLLVSNGFFHNNANHIVGGAAQGAIEIRSSELAGTTGGSAIQVDGLGQLQISDSLLHDGSPAPDVVARAHDVLIENSRIIGQGASEGAIALGHADNVVIRGNTLAAGVVPAGEAVIALGGEGERSGSSFVLVEGNAIALDGGGGAAVINRANVDATISGNQLHNVGTVSRGPAVEIGNSHVASGPTLDRSQPWRDDPSTASQSDAVFVAAREMVDANLLDLLMQSQRDDGGAFDPDALVNLASRATLNATPGDDVLAGGGAGGATTASFAGSPGAVQIFLALARAQDTGGSGVDRITGVDDIVGSAGSDRLAGASGDNLILGGAGDDHLSGGLGSDRLLGGPGNDVIAGGRGIDVIAGGTGGDRFVVEPLSEAHPQPLRDVIVDFSQREGDTIDFRAVDANTLLAGDQAFTFVGREQLDGQAGRLHQRPFLDNTIVEGDVNGDGTPDVQIQLVGTHVILQTDLWL